jgi:hypothetical protein
MAAGCGRAGPLLPVQATGLANKSRHFRLQPVEPPNCQKPSRGASEISAPAKGARCARIILSEPDQWVCARVRNGQQPHAIRGVAWPLHLQLRK